MADLIASSWSEQDNNNTSNSPLGIQGNYAPSSVAPVIRAIMGGTKRFYNQINALVTSTGTGAAYVLTYVQNPTAYSKGIRYAWFAHADNTGAATVNIGSIGAKQLLSVHGLPLTAGQIKADDFVEMIYNGTSFQLISEQKHSPLFMQSAAIQASGNNSPTLSLSANSTIRAQASSGLSGGFNVTLRNANNAIVRSLVVPETGSATLGGDIIWTSGNMGANSALNADLLDGQHGAWYQDLTNSTGTLPNARLSGNYSFANLDLSNGFATAQAPYARYGVHVGRDASTAASASSTSMGYFGVNGSGGIYMSRKATAGGSDTSNLTLANDTATGLTHNGATVWTSANDGSGSGLDAGLLEGQNAAYFRNLANSTGTLPNARIGGAYDGITNLSMTGTLGITSAAPTINFIDTTAGSYNTRLMVDANNWYLQKQADGATTWTTFAQFEMDTTNAYLNGSQIWTQTNHNHLAIGTTAATARSAMGLGGLSTMNIADLMYSGTANNNTNFPVNSYIVYGGSYPDLNETVAIRLATANSNAFTTGGTGAVVAGTWRFRGRTSSGENLAHRVA